MEKSIHLTHQSLVQPTQISDVTDGSRAALLVMYAPSLEFFLNKNLVLVRDLVLLQQCLMFFFLKKTIPCESDNVIEVQC